MRLIQNGLAPVILFSKKQIIRVGGVMLNVLGQKEKAFETRLELLRNLKIEYF